MRADLLTEHDFRIRSSLAGIDHTARHSFDLGMMREHMNATIAPFEKGAQNPTDDADDDRAPKCTAETIDVKARNKRRNP